MPILDIVEMGEATTTCRNRLRQLLERVEDGGSINEEDLVSLITSTSCPMGHELHVRPLTGLLTKVDGSRLCLSRAGEDWLIENGRPAAEWGGGAPPSAPELRTWQVAALDAWAAHGRSGVVEAVTGTGKSRVGVEAIREALGDDYDVVVVVPTTALVDQWERTLRNAGIGGVAAMTSGSWPTWLNHRVIVGTVQSLYPNPLRREDGKVLVVADECHRYGAPEWARALDDSYRRRLGLTAIFERNDEGLRTLMRYFGGGPVYRIGFPEAIRTGVVARYDVKLMGVDLTSRERHRYDDADERAKEARSHLLAAEFPAEPFGAFMTAVQQAAESDPDPTIEDVARRYLKAFSERVDIMAGAAQKSVAMEVLAPAVGASRGALVFTRRKEAAEELALILKEEGVAAHPIHSGHTMAQRRERLAGLKTGRVQALVAPTVLDEGVDVPDVDLGIVMSGSKSRRQMVQRMGRVLRLKPDGRKATFVVVYARGTAEDLSVGDGQEGALDLIVESADRVSHLYADGQLLVEQEVRATNDVHNGDRTVLTASDDTPKAVLQTDVGTPEQNVRELPSALRKVDPEELAMTRKARDEYASAHGVGDSEATASLRTLLRQMLKGHRIYPRDVPYNSYTLRGDDAELVITPDRFVGYRRYAQAIPRDGRVPLAAQSGEEVAPELTSEEVDVLDHLVPMTIQVNGDALEAVCDVFELGDLKMSDALREARDLLTTDLGRGATVQKLDNGYAVRCALATWYTDGDISEVVGVEPSSPREPSPEGGPASTREVSSLDAAGPLATPATAEDHLSEAQQPADHQELVAQARAVSEFPSDTHDMTTDLVDQLERLGSLRRAGLLTEEEFTAAKARLLF